jgi:hypothetical protein
MLVAFQLSMPNRGSWNGKWSGQDRQYILIKSISARYAKSQEHFKDLLEKGKDSWYYSWNDGWGASISAEVISAAEAKKRRKLSAGFCGYEWMVQSIISYGEISTATERKEVLS